MQCLTRKRIILGITGAVSFLIFLIISGISGFLAGKQDTQNMAQRWSAEGDAAQISCFFSQNGNFSQDSVMSFEHGLDSALIEASIVNDSENEGARLWADAYSATGTITLSSNNGTVSVNAVGVGGDFFQFHPLKLVSGSYFSGNDVMKDYCLIDEEIAWQLFGSNDVAGQYITIKGIPHIITGVIEDTGRLEDAAGLSDSVAYVSYETLSAYGQANKIGSYEIVMPNPVESYALNYVKENIGVQETELEVLENTSRYSLLSLIKVIGGFGTRSMNGKAIIYPYWENIARGYEDILALLLLLEAVFLLYPIVLVIIAVVIAWKHKTWNARSIYLYVQDKWERFWERRRANRMNRKHDKHMDEDIEQNIGRQKKNGKRKRKREEA